ncbi:MAG: hypothetical protein AAGJ18_00225 [Bacteroidota bacterium]
MGKYVFRLVLFLLVTGYPMCEREDNRVEAQGNKVVGKIALFERQKIDKYFPKEFQRKKYNPPPVSMLTLFNETLNDAGIRIIPVETPNDVYEVTIKLLGKKMKQNNHVGHKWAYNFKVGTTSISI